MKRNDLTPTAKRMLRSLPAGTGGPVIYSLLQALAIELDLVREECLKRLEILESGERPEDQQ